MGTRTGNEFAPNGTKTIFTYYGDHADIVDPITGKRYPLTPQDTLLYEIVPPGENIQSSSANKYVYLDPTVHRRKNKCEKCERPIMEHLLIGATSIMRCVCGREEIIKPRIQG